MKGPHTLNAQRSWSGGGLRDQVRSKCRGCAGSTVNQGSSPPNIPVHVPWPGSNGDPVLTESPLAQAKQILHIVCNITLYDIINIFHIATCHVCICYLFFHIGIHKEIKIFFFYYLLIYFGCAACGILVSHRCLRWKHTVLTTGPPGPRSQDFYMNSSNKKKLTQIF